MHILHILFRTFYNSLPLLSEMSARGSELWNSVCVNDHAGYRRYLRDHEKVQKAVIYLKNGIVLYNAVAGGP